MPCLTVARRVFELDPDDAELARLSKAFTAQGPPDSVCYLARVSPKFVLPDAKDPPSSLLKVVGLPAVASHIGHELRLPESA